MTEHAFFQDLAILMTIAGFVALAFGRLGWPKALGYILAGVVMNEHTWGGSFLIDESSTRVFGQLGVVFLMFGMGLSFSAKEIKKIKAVALPCAVIDTLMMIWLGYMVGTKVFGWAPVASMFLGVAICDSATTLLAKVIDEAGWCNREFSKYVLGTSVFEDIICVGAIAVATGFANGGGMNLLALGKSLGCLSVFFLAVLVFGLVFVPRLLVSISKRSDSEALLLTLLGCCFLVSYIAYHYDFSLALGAFLVGVIGAMSDVRDRIAELVEPLKLMYSAVFFISIGLLVNPPALWMCLPQVLLVSAVVVFGKAINNFIGSILCGLDIKTSVQNALSLAQIGEFAFMVAVLYAGFTDDADSPMFQIAVGASLLTTLLNPWLIRVSDPLGDWVVRRTPERFRRWQLTYVAWLEKIRSSDNHPAFILLKASLIRLGIYAVLILAVSAICAVLARADYSRFSTVFDHFSSYIFFGLSNVFAMSLLPLVVSASRSAGDEVAILLTGDGNSRWHQSVQQLIRFVTLWVGIGLFFLELTMLNFSTSPLHGQWQWVLVVVVLLVGLAGWQFFKKAGRRATKRFLEAVTAEERREGIVAMTTIAVPEGAIYRLQLKANSPAIGGTVVTLNIRAKTGASVVSVYREGKITRNIGPDWVFQPDDILVALGDPHQIASLKDLLGII